MTYEMTDKMPRRNFLRNSLGLLAAGQGANLLAAAKPARAAAQQVSEQRTSAQPTHNPVSAKLYPGFRQMRIQTSGATIQAVAGGSGPAVLLLHGHPETHLAYHKVGPRLAQRFSVVAADLRGYGDSSHPPDGQNHFNYSKRAMGQDMAEVMTHLGFERFAVAGHDRGARVVTRMALDYPDRVTHLAVLDNLPTRTMFRRVDKDFAMQYYHWFFRAQPAPLPETLIENSVEFYLRRSFGSAPPGTVSDEVFAEYLRCYRNPGVIHGVCEDWRAGSGIDLEHDDADWNQKITCPVLALWAGHGNLPKFFGDVVAAWGEKAADVRGKALDSGHLLAEEAPDQVFAEFNAFFSA
jgi:haloacetate dehalogenase